MMVEQQEKQPYRELGADHEKLAKLKQEVLEMEKRLAEKKAESGVEKVFEQPPAAYQEGAITQERIEPASLPATPAPYSQQIQGIDPQNQVQALCNLAFQKGVDAAIEAAQSLNNPYILDEFHDVMLDKLYERLKGEGKIREE